MGTIRCKKKGLARLWSGKSGRLMQNDFNTDYREEQEDVYKY